MAEHRPRWYATGRRKEAVARVWLSEGTGRITINERDLDHYFGGRETSKMTLRQPLDLVEAKDRFDVMITVRGGGSSGQAGAMRHGLARALTLVDTEWRPPLKKAGMLTRDARTVERKKYGRAGARKRFQFSKR
jgi:small subunit ribosomal protein S9